MLELIVLMMVFMGVFLVLFMALFAAKTRSCPFCRRGGINRKATICPHCRSALQPTR